MSRIPIPVAPALLLAALAALVSGCASFQPNSLHQAVLVRTQPEGATIYVDGEDVGQTPRYVLIRRGAHARLELESALAPPEDESKHTVLLKSRYRWRESFFSNFVFLTVAPLGWIVDIGNGAAWSAENPETIPVRLTAKDKALKHAQEKKKVVAIAPPSAPTLALSDAGARALESVLRESVAKNTELVSFEDSLTTFLRYGYDFDDEPTEDDRRNLYYHLDANTIFESKVVTVDDQLVLEGVEKNIYTGEVSDPVHLAFSPSDDVERFFAVKRWWSRLVPNSVGLDFVTEKIAATRGTQTYSLEPSGSEALWAVGLRYLSAIDITNVPERRSGNGGRWSKSLVPAIHLSRKQVHAVGLADAGSGSTEQTFIRWQVAAGYGGEGGYQYGRHYFYGSVIPLLEWNEISWAESARDHSITEWVLQLSIELGYIYYFSSNWAVRVFGRQIPEASKSWAEALGSRLPASPEPLTASTSSTGISITYRFEPRFENRLWKFAQ